MKYKKKLEVLRVRQANYEASKNKQGLTKPGSQKGKW